MTNSADPERFRLPGPELRRIFDEQIRPIYVGTARQTPTVFFIAGQPGAGKTTVESRIAQQLGVEEAVRVDGDDLFSYHPAFERLTAENDHTARTLLADAADEWWTMLTDYLREQRTDIIISAPLAGPDWAAARFTDFRQAGYRVEYVFVAVHEARSLLAILDRYQHDKDQYGVGRFVRPDAHDRAYGAVLGTVDRLEAERLVDAVYVVRRGGDLVHQNSLDEAGNWRDPPGLRRAIENERSRAWTVDERNHFQRRVEATAGRISEHLAPVLADAIRRAMAHLGPAGSPSSVATVAQAWPSSTRDSMVEQVRSGDVDPGVAGASSTQSTRSDRGATR
ncbi:zeta toxin family protein [Micromonospora sp. CA-246542]|uniref:zeta toxin family protein n=1 Tax=Micromonospora sp. CA-246542 TaxID=3239959 RepID=UPI003D8B73E9